VNNWTPDRPTKPGNVPTNNLGWTKVTERLPPYQENIRVLIYTEGVEFNGVQFFDVPADSLYGDADDLEEAQRHATHWMLLTDLRLPYVEPPDPFAEPVPSLRERVEALPRFDPAASRRLPHMQPTADGLFLARSDVLALFKVPR